MMLADRVSGCPDTPQRNKDNALMQYTMSYSSAW